MLAAVLLLAVSPRPPVPPVPAFEPARARGIVEHLALRIGPRPAGSEAEARALGFLEEAFRSRGLRTDRFPVGRALRTEIAGESLVARLPGTEAGAGALLFGAHSDTAGPDVPGANDDAAGVAILVEVARVEAERARLGQGRRHDLLFAVFAAEEEGLRGSRAWAEREDLAPLRFVLTLDPPGYGPLSFSPFPGPPPPDFQRALARIARRKAIRDRIAFPPAYAVVPRFTRIPFGADHEPFCERPGLPAWNLSNRLLRWTYHTPADSISVIDPRTLEAGGLVVEGFIEEAEAGRIPGPFSPPYAIQPTPWGPVFLGETFLWIFGALGCLLGILALRAPGDPGARLPDLLLAWIEAGLLTLGVAALALAPEKIAELRTGWRFPWTAHPLAFLAAGALAGLGGAGLAARALHLLPSLRAARSGCRRAALVLLTGITGGLLFSGRPESAWLAAFPLACLSVAVLLRAGPWTSRAVVFLAALPVATFLAPLDWAAAAPLLGLRLPDGAFLAILASILLPFGLFLAGTPASPSSPDQERPRGLAGTLSRYGLPAAALLACGFVQTLPAYDRFHPRFVEATALVRPGGKGGLLRLESIENLRGVEVGGLRIDLPAGETILPFEAPEPLASWEVETLPDGVLLRLRSGVPFQEAEFRAEGFAPESPVVSIPAVIGQRSVHEVFLEPGEANAIRRVSATVRWRADVSGVPLRGENVVFGRKSRTSRWGIRTPAGRTAPP